MAGDVQIGILGPLEVRVGFGEPVAVVGPRLRALLVRLALDPDRVVLGDALVDAVWGEQPPAGAANALQSLVSRLRRLLPGIVESHPAGYRLGLQPDAVDAVRFEALALAGRDELRRDPRQAAVVLREALALWRGPALADVAATGFAGPAVARLEELRLGALEDRIDADLAGGEPEALVAELDELVADHPLRERLWGQLMRALAGAGRPADALAAYERLRSLLAEQLGIDPSQELQAIHLAVLRGPAAAEPPAAGRLSAPRAARTNLRAQITSFVGRDEDIARITAVLAGARLVTLTGPGGAGKTRLAGEAAARMVERTPAGVWLVELAPVGDPGDLPQTVLSLFGARELGLLAPRGASAVAPVDRLVEAIGDKHLLLVMDNCEHLVGAVAGLVGLLLGRCPGLRVLATSREPLKIPGEVLHPVGPLAIPEGAVTPAEALGYPAVRLFADRGAAARPAFELDEATLAPALRICRGLDGIPLAIELAAARLRALSATQIADRLDDRFRLLGDGSRAPMARHQTLRAVVDWSWDLLGDPERVLLRRLAVFAGGATLEAVERVCAGHGPGGPAADEVLYLLAALVDKSLVVVAEHDRSGGVRYRLLETIRAYAEERLRAAGEEETLRRAHHAYFLDLAERADPELRGRHQLAWVGRLSAERENLRAALRWAVEGREVAAALRMVAALGWYWFLQSARAEAVEWATQALALPGPAPPPVRAQVLAFRALITLSGGVDFDRSLEQANEAMAILDRLPEGEARRLHPMLVVLPALVTMFHNDDAGAVDQVRQLGDHVDPWVRAIAHVFAGGLLVNLGEAVEAEREFDLGLAAFRELGERWGVGQALIARAELSAARGHHEPTVAALREAGEIFEQLGDREDVAQLAIRVAQERARAGELGQALDHLEVADRIAQEIGAEDQKLFVSLTRADITRRQGRLEEAREQLERAMEAFRRSGYPVAQVHAVALCALGHLEVAAGDLEAARGCYGRALEVAVGTADRPVIARAVELLADVAMAGGDAEEAATLLGTAEVLRGMPDEADLDVRRVRDAARAALGAEGFARAHRRGAARRREEVLASLPASVSASGAGTPAGPAGRTPRR